MTNASPVIDFYPYQRNWLNDDARFKIGMFARQTGKTFSTCGEIVDDCIQHEIAGKRTRWVILSRGERQAREAMDEAIKPITKAFYAVYGQLKEPASFVESDFNSDSGVTYKALDVEFPGGSRITALPANPDTARGFSANVLLDEFAFHKDSRGIWKALFPVISKPGLKLRVISTPNGKANKFYELMTDVENGWSRHICDIYQAVEQGCPRDVDELRRALADPDAWAQEYELQWLDEASAWLSYDLIASCESQDANVPGNYAGGDCYVGVDIGRRRDLTVIWISEQVGDVAVTREVIKMHRAPFIDQDAEVDRVMRSYRVKRLCMDQTGLGEKMVEDAQRRYGSYVVEGVLFTGPVKQDLAIRLKRSFEDRQVRISPERDTRDSLHAVKKIVTAAGNERFDAERTEKGHADEFWALALAEMARDTGTIEYDYRGAGKSRTGNAGGKKDFMRPDHSSDDAGGPRWRQPLGLRIKGGGI